MTQSLYQAIYPAGRGMARNWRGIQPQQGMEIENIMGKARRDTCMTLGVMIALFGVAISPIFSLCNAAAAQVSAAPSTPVSTPTYADLVDKVLVSPIIAVVRPRKTRFLAPEAAGAPPAGHARALVTAQLITLIRGDDGVPPLLTYIVDLPLTARGKRPPALKAAQVLLARRTSRADFLQLDGPDRQMVWTAQLDARVRAITAEVLAIDAPPIVTEVGDAFHTFGTIEGEGDTRIFLRTNSNKPISLAVSRRTGSPPNWSVSVDEVVDDGGVRPQRDTLLWYSLACHLPATLPEESTRTLPVLDAEAVRADYAIIIEALGSCPRTL